MTDKTPVPVSSEKHRAKWLRHIGFAVLLLGPVGGSEIYRRGMLSPDIREDPEMTGFDRAEKRQMGLMYGTQGRLILELENSLCRPPTQAIIVLVAAVLVAGGCWHFASLLDSKRD